MNTAIGILGYKYFKKKDGDNIIEPIQVISAVLDWADIATNNRGKNSFNR
jgi:hypothetical protein